MTFNKAIVPAAETREEEFTVDELFISRTDKRGVIQSGNEVFRRVSGFEWDRLVGSPHKIVRNPDMPKAVFWLLWKTIQSGNPMVVYVKNLSASGRWYWVLAVVVPLADGYLSAHIKPTSPLFAQTKLLYAEILEAEATLLPEKSAELLLSRLAAMGFANYPEYAARVLEMELASRDLALGNTNATGTKFLGSVGSSLKAMNEKQADLMREFEALQSIPTNMRIIASRLEPSGGPISAISDNYKYASSEVSRRLEEFAGSENNLCQSMSQIVRDGLFLSAISRVMAQVQTYLSSEDNSAAVVDFNAERTSFAQVAAQFRQKAQAVMHNAEFASGELNIASGEIRRMMLGLDTIRVMGRVESGRLGAVGIGLAATIDQLDTRHASISNLLQNLMDLSAIIKTGIKTYQRHAGI